MKKGILGYGCGGGLGTDGNRATDKEGWKSTHAHERERERRVRGRERERDRERAPTADPQQRPAAAACVY